MRCKSSRRRTRDLFRDGFYAKTQADELKCPDLELNVLQSIEDVTARVNAAVKPEMKPAEAFAARRAAMSAIEKESLDKTNLRSDVVTLYQGGAYHLYRYKKYTDVRLVFAPEQQIASFGGDVDNFEFPRFNLDISFFRAYEDGKPVTGEALVQVQHRRSEGRRSCFRHRPSRHDQSPGDARQADPSPRHHAAVHAWPVCGRWKRLSSQYGERGPENKRQATTDLHRYANSRKAFSGQYQGLLDPQDIAGEGERRKIASSGRSIAPGASLQRAAFENASRRIADIQKHLCRIRKATQPDRNRHGVPEHALHDCSQHRPPDERNRKRKRQAAARIPRLQSGLAEIASLLAGADLSGTGTGQVAGRHHVPRRATWRRTIRWSRKCWMEVAGPARG